MKKKELYISYDLAYFIDELYSSIEINNDIYENKLNLLLNEEFYNKSNNLDLLEIKNNYYLSLQYNEIDNLIFKEHILSNNVLNITNNTNESIKNLNNKINFILFNKFQIEDDIKVLKEQLTNTLLQYKLCSNDIQKEFLDNISSYDTLNSNEQTKEFIYDLFHDIKLSSKLFNFDDTKSILFNICKTLIENNKIDINFLDYSFHSLLEKDTLDFEM